MVDCFGIVSLDQVDSSSDMANISEEALLNIISLWDARVESCIRLIIPADSIRPILERS